MKVKKIFPGDIIGFICPSTKMDMESSRIPRLESIIEKLGYKIKYGSSCYASEGYLAGTDDLRVNDIHEMFLDPEIKAIICMKGGYGASRIVDKIDYQIIEKNPKLFMGFSDITVLLNNFSKYANLPTIHGQVGIFLGREDIDDVSLNDFKKLLNEDMSGRLFHNSEARCLNSGIAKGKIVGGNLTLITNLVGSMYDIDFKDNIVFIEEVDEQPYKIDRMFAQLRLSGKLSQAKGFIFGHFTNCDTPDNTQTVEQLINEYFNNINVPVITNFASGHEFPFFNIPIGLESIMDADKREIKIIGEIYEKN